VNPSCRCSAAVETLSGWCQKSGEKGDRGRATWCTANRVETRAKRMRRRRLSQKRLADCCWLLFLLQGFNTLRWAEGRDANNGRGKRGASDAPPEPEMNIHATLYIYLYTNVYYTMRCICNARFTCELVSNFFGEYFGLF